jgi:acetyltransferase-like isoleucine patch superfamily enzyme
MKISKALLARQKLADARSSPFKGYVELTAGNVGLGRFALYELLTFVCGPMPGGLGLLLRRKLYPWLFRQSGRGLVLGRSLVLRHPDSIELGNHVVIDDNSLVDGRAGIRLDDGVIINRNCSLKAKTGPIRVGRRTTIGANSVIVSLTGVEIGEAVIIAGGCHLSAGGYDIDQSGRALLDGGVLSKGPIKIGNDVWVGTGAIILDGINVGDHAVVAAGAVVTSDVPERAVVAGVPAKVLRRRE